MGYKFPPKITFDLSEEFGPGITATVRHPKLMGHEAYQALLELPKALQGLNTKDPAGVDTADIDPAEMATALGAAGKVARLIIIDWTVPDPDDEEKILPTPRENPDVEVPEMILLRIAMQVVPLISEPTVPKGSGTPSRTPSSGDQPEGTSTGDLTTTS